MKRFALVGLVGLLAATRPLLAYDGHNPVTYDQTIAMIRVVMTAPSETLVDGPTRIFMTAYVPVLEDTLDKLIVLEIRQRSSTGDFAVASCQHTADLSEVNQVVQLTCEFVDVLNENGTEDGGYRFYPYVLRNSSKFRGEAEHDARTTPLLITLRSADDSYEPNDTFRSASTFDSPGQIVANELVSQNEDYYNVVVPPGATQLTVRIDFWHILSDLDLYIRNDRDLRVTESTSSEDYETVTFKVQAGDAYYIDVRNYTNRPTFYNLSVTFFPLDLLTITGPAGTPNPVASGGPVAMSASAIDTLNHPVSFKWQASCPTLPSAGGFTPNAVVQAPTWTAPANLLGTPQSCVITLTASDGHGTSSSKSYQQTVESVPDSITLLAGAAGAPDPVPPSGSVLLSVVAIDALGHELTYEWQATCPTLATSGVFVPDARTRTPFWVAPANPSNTVHTCAISVLVRDGFNQSISSPLVQRVDSADNVAITNAASSSVNPIASGAQGQLNVGARDSMGHALSYAWTAQCPTLADAGGFVPSAQIASPLWQAPVNTTPVDQTCTLSVVASDNAGHSASSAVSVQVTARGVVDEITFTAGPTGSPATVAPGGTVTLSVAARDPFEGHVLKYVWSAVCPTLAGAGTFSNPNVQSPTWIAPVNRTGTLQTCTLAVTVTDTANAPAQTRSVQQQVSSIANVLSITSGPVAVPNPVSSGGVVGLAVTADDLLDGELTYAWSAQCPGLGSAGSFSDTGVPAPRWTAPLNSSGTDRACTLSVTVSDGRASSRTASISAVVKNGIPCSYAVTAMPATIATAGGTGSFVLTANDAACPWTTTSDSSWLTISSAPAGSGTTTVTYSAAANTGANVRVGTVNVAGRLVQVPQAGVGYRYYFAEGATSKGFFDTRLALLNPTPGTTANVAIDFQATREAAVLTHTLTVAGGHRATIDVASLSSLNPALAALASAEFSTIVRSDVPLVVDRTMTWDGRGYGSHAESAIGAPASTWYLAEGATLGNFELYYLIQNPNNVALDNEIEITYLLPPPAAPIVRHYSLGANTRGNIAVHAEPGLEDVEVSGVIRTPPDKPVIVERAMYLTTGGLFYGAGHESAAVRAPALQWFFAEGATGEFFDLFILVANPNDADAHISVTYLFEDGTTCSRAGTVDRRSRYNIWVDAEAQYLATCPKDIAHAAVSTTITSDIPVIAERTMWWPGPTAATWAEAHNAPGATTTGTLWAMADGEQGGSSATETYVLIANTSPYRGMARVTLHFEDGTSLSKELELHANGRRNVPIGAEFDEAVKGKRFGTTVESLPVAGQARPAQIVVERAMYANGPSAAFWAAGTDVLATRLR